MSEIVATTGIYCKADYSKSEDWNNPESICGKELPEFTSEMKTSVDGGDFVLDCDHDKICPDCQKGWKYGMLVGEGGPEPEITTEYGDYYS